MTEKTTKKSRGWVSYLFAGLLFIAGGYFGVPALQNPAVAVGAGDMIEGKVNDLMGDEEAAADVSGDQ